MDFFKQYPSGLKLVAAKMDNFYTVSFGVFVNVGSVLEEDETNGYSHFIEHLLFKGTKRRSALQISEEMDDIGANINAFTAKDCTCFYTKSASQDLEKCVDVLSDMYFNAAFPSDELDREKGVVLEEIKMCEDNPDDVSQDLISEALFYNQSLGRTILGKPQNIKHSDRHSIQEFKNLHYIPSKTVVSVAGDFDFERLDKLVEKYFESNFSKGQQDVYSEPNVRYSSRFLHRFKKIEQVHLQIAVGGCALNSPSRHALSILASTLGGGMSSRLFQTVREKNGLAYSVYAYPSFYSNCGMLEIYAGLSPENTRKTCGLLQQEIRRFVDEGITQKELDRAKAQAVNGLYMNVESNLTLMRLYGRCMLKVGSVYNADKEVESFKCVTAKQVNDLATELFCQKYACSYVGKNFVDFDAVSKLGTKSLLD